MTYSRISIIYNPNSTGDSQAKAKRLASALKGSVGKATIECVPTKYAGHAEKLARQIAKKEASPLIVSSSGDGGYNEVINGVLAAGNPKAICAVLPAGNANDHSRTLHDKPLVRLIQDGSVKKIDVLKVEVRSGRKTQTRYAHSYVGLGITPVVAVELNEHSLNSMLEGFIVLKSFLKYRPFKIQYGGRVHKLDSLIFGNINQMAKVLTIAPQSRPDDGKFEIVRFPSSRKWTLVKRLAKAAIDSLDDVERASSFEFQVQKRMPMQLDGEILQLQKGDQVRVTNDKRRLAVVA